MAVGRTRVGCPGWGGQGGRAQQALACKDEQRYQHCPGGLNRVRSSLTHLVSLDVGATAIDPAL